MRSIDTIQDYFDERVNGRSNILSDLECPGCRKHVRMEDIQAIVDNKEGYKDAEGKNICKDCRERMTRAANIFCLKCSQLVMKVDIGTTSRGFQINPQAKYHFNYCFRCVGKNPKYTVEEEEFFKKWKYSKFSTGTEGSRNEV